MSQAKVDRNKELKRNRKAIQAKKRREALYMKLCGGVVVLALAAWLGYSAADSYQKKVNSEPVTADLTALDDYMSGLPAEE